MNRFLTSLGAITRGIKKEIEKQVIEKPWIDTRLTEEELKFLNVVIATSIKGQKLKQVDWKDNAAGNVSRCDLIDKDNWFYKTVLKPLTEKMFYRENNNYYSVHIEKEEPPPVFEMNRFWVNFQKKHDHIPLHDHGSLYSFVVFIKIPTHWEDQHKVPKSRTDSAFTNSVASDFQFVWTRKNSEMCERANLPLSPEDNGRMLFFPAWLNHMVYPFYGIEEERVTISGNIILEDLNKSKVPEEVFKPSGNVYEEKEKTLKILENSVEFMKKELKQMKKADENVG